MAKIRTIKPELFRHEALFEAEQDFQLPLRLAFAGLLTCCDREGRFRWRPRQLKLDVMPYDEIDFSRVLDALATRGFLVKYEVLGEVYGCIPTWHKHQHINNKESDSVLPDVASGTLLNSHEAVTSLKNPHKNNELITRDERVGHALSTRSQSCLESLRNSEGEMEEEMELEGNIKKEKQAKEKSLADEKKLAEKNLALENSVTQDSDLKIATAKNLHHPNPIAEVFEHWQTTLQHPNAKLDKKRKACIRQALALGFSVEQLQSAIVGCSLTPHNLGHNERGERYDGLHVIFKNADNIERFIRNCHNPPQQNFSTTFAAAKNKTNFAVTPSNHSTRLSDDNFDNKQYTQTPLADISWFKS